MEKEEFKKKFPKLFEEMEKGVSETDIQLEVENPEPERKFAGYDPNVIDFIRRCKDEEEAYKIIKYLEERGETSKEKAEELCTQLREKGIRSFGRRKKPGYYEREGK